MAAGSTVRLWVDAAGSPTDLPLNHRLGAYPAVSGLVLWTVARRPWLDRDRAAGWVVALGALPWAVIYAAYGVQAATGALPSLLETLMPYRLSNVAAVLVIPLSVTAIAWLWAEFGKGARVVPALIPLLLLFVAMRVVSDRDAMFRNGIFVVLDDNNGISQIA